MSILIDKELHTKFKVVCAQRRVPMKKVVEELIMRWIES